MKHIRVLGCALPVLNQLEEPKFGLKAREGVLIEVSENDVYKLVKSMSPIIGLSKIKIVLSVII